VSALINQGLPKRKGASALLGVLLEASDVRGKRGLSFWTLG